MMVLQYHHPSFRRMSVFPKDERLDEIGLSRGQPCFIHPC